MNGEILSRFKCAKPPRSKWGYAVCYDHAIKVNCEDAKELRQERKVPSNEIKNVEVKRRSTPQIIKSDQDSYGITSCLDEEHAGLESIFGIQLSPLKALHPTILKSCFPDTIFMAQHNTLLQIGGRTDSANLQQKERIEKKLVSLMKMHLPDEVDIIKRLPSFTSKRWTYNDPLTTKYNAKMASMRPIAKPKGSRKLKDWEQP